MSKWSALTGGKISETTLKSEASKEWGLSSFLALAVGIVAIVAIVAAVVRSKNKKSEKSIATIEPELTIVQPKVASVPVPEAPEVVPTVEAKSFESPIVIDRYFSSNEGPTDGPVLDHSEGLTFFDFQKAFQQGRQGPTQDHKEVSDVGSLDTLRVSIQESGKTVSQYLDANGLQVSDALLEALQQETFTNTRQTFGDMDIYDQESMIVAREALQDVPTNVSAAMVLPILREIYGARMSATKDSIVLPEMPAEQRKGLEYWASKNGNAGSLAKTILSRN
jgi:hypothetical protein